MLYIVLQIVAFQALFLLVYDVFLRKETFFNYNRVYLLFTSMLSLVLPFLKFERLKAVTTKDFVIQLPEVFIGEPNISQQGLSVAEQSFVGVQEASTPVWQIIMGLGMLIALMVLSLKLVRLYRLKANNPKRWKGDILVVNLMKSSAAFSFFNTIFLGERIPKNEQPVIYKHELVHIKEWHSLDHLYMELLRIIFWFNPLIYIYQNRIKELHEYIADAKAVKQNCEANYYQTLLNQVFDVNNVSFINTFFKKSLIKKRITMLQKSKSKQIHLVKYGLLIPLILGMLIYTSTEVRAFQELNTAHRSIQEQELSEEELIKKYYDEIVLMAKNGATHIEISKYPGNANDFLDKYILSKEEFLKSKAYIRFVADDMIRRKSENGTLEDSDFDNAEMLKKQAKTYTEYRVWKKTTEAKELWEANIKDGERRLFVEDLENKTKEEQRQYNALLKQLETDAEVKKLVITDGKSTLVLDDFKSNDNQAISHTEIIEVPFSVIDEVPTTKDCKNLATNKERKKCMSNFIAKHVNSNFNIGLADSLEIEGKQRIFLAFKIDKQGLIKDVKARASHKALEDEARRVIKTLPQFIPGKHKGETVVVPYSLPIVFQVAAKESSTSKYDAFQDSIDNKDKAALKEIIVQRDRILKNSSPNNPVVTSLNRQIDSLSNKGLQKNDAYAKTEDQSINFSKVTKAPVHMDCKGLSDETARKKCTSNAVAKFVNLNFDMNLAKSLKLSDDVQRIFTNFTIDSSGFVTAIKVKAPHPKLEEEATRVLKLLPQFVPGEQDGEKVNVNYSLPIMFQFNN